MIHDHQSVARLLNCILQIWKCVNCRPLWSIINDKKSSFGLDIVGQLSLFFLLREDKLLKNHSNASIRVKSFYRDQRPNLYAKIQAQAK